MKITLQLDDQVYREAMAEAARLGVTLAQLIEDGLHERLEGSAAGLNAEVAERDCLMDALLKSTGHFRVGVHPTREGLYYR